MTRVPSTCPERPELELERFEGRHAQRDGVAPSAEESVFVAVEREGFEGVQARVEEPNVRHALARVDGQLIGAIDGLRGWREYFRHPIGGEVEAGRIGHLWHSRAAPTREVGHQHIRSEMQLGLVEYHPATGATAAAVKRIAEHHAENRRRDGVGTTGARLRVELSVQQLSDHVRWQVEQVLVAGAAECGVNHVLAPPNALQIHRDGSEWLCEGDFVTGACREQHPMGGLQSIGLEGFESGVEQPEMGDAQARVERELARAIEAGGRRGQDLAHPIGCECDEGVRRGGGHALASPTGKVWDDDVLGQVQLWLIQDPPAPWAAVTELQVGDEGCSESRRTHGMRYGRSRAREQLAIDDLSREVLGQREDILVASRTRRGQSHARTIARPAPGLQSQGARA